MDFQRDFLQLRDHLESLADLRARFVAGTEVAGSERGLTIISDRVGPNKGATSETIQFVAVTEDLHRHVSLAVGIEEPTSCRVSVTSVATDLPNKDFVLLMETLKGWLHNVVGFSYFSLCGEMTSDLVSSLQLSGWKVVANENENPAGGPIKSPERADTKQPNLVLSSRWTDPNGQQVLTAGPSIGPMEITNVDLAVRMGWNNSHSDFISAFEREVADFVGCDFALATSSCTGALHLALLACGIGPGDEVIVPEITWVATGSAVRYVGATPVFVDIDLTTWNLDIQAVRKAVSTSTKAIIPVHLYGVPADMAGVMEVATQYGLRVIEDAAPALGAKWTGRPVGSFGDVGCFSFQGAKMLVTGEGGMFVTNDEDVYLRAKKLQEHGRRTGSFWIDQVGYKYKMSNLQAALGLGQVSRVLNQIERKREINELYREYLGDDLPISFQSSHSLGFSIDWMTSICLEEDFSARREDLMEHLKAAGIDSRPVFPQMSQFTFWGTKSVLSNPVAAKVSQAAINLPSGVGLDEKTIQRVSGVIQDFFGL